MDEGPAIGIDFGTSYCCVAVYEKDNVKFIRDEFENIKIPSYVAFTERGHLVGETAKHQSKMNPENTIFGFKRLIGRRFNDPVVQEDIKHWPFNVVNVNERPCVEVQYKGQKLWVHPEELCSLMLTKLKQLAEDNLKVPITQAVIAVPASFRDSQRRGILLAADMAGLEIIQIISEPAAVAIAYGLHKKDVLKKNTLICDMGGGTTDVTVISTEGYTFEMKSTSGNVHMGGEDFDNKFIQYLIKKFQEEKNIDLSSNKKSKCKLKLACEKAKRDLSLTRKANIEIDSLCEGIDFNIQITRDDFDQIITEVTPSIQYLVTQTINDAKLTIDNIDDVVLVGGSTRVPVVQTFFQRLKNKPINKMVNVDEAVANGAAALAALLVRKIQGNLRFILSDITPFSIGIVAAGSNIIDIIFESNSKIPNKQTRHFLITNTAPENFFFSLLEIKNIDRISDCLLGTFMLSEMMQRKEVYEVNQAELTFEMNIHGILEVKVLIGCKEFAVTATENMYLKELIRNMKKNTNMFRQEEQNERFRVAAKDRLESYCMQVKKQCKDMISKQHPTLSESLEDIFKYVGGLHNWLEMNEFASLGDYEVGQENLRTKFENVATMYQCLENERLRIEAKNNFDQFCLYASKQILDMYPNASNKLLKRLDYMEGQINGSIAILGQSAGTEMYEEHKKKLKDLFEKLEAHFKREKEEERSRMASSLNECCLEVQKEIYKITYKQDKIPLGCQTALYKEATNVQGILNSDRIFPREWYESTETCLRDKLQKMKDNPKEYHQNYIDNLSAEQAKENLMSYCTELDSVIKSNSSLSESHATLLQKIKETYLVLDRDNIGKDHFVKREQELRTMFDKLKTPPSRKWYSKIININH